MRRLIAFATVVLALAAPAARAADPSAACETGLVPSSTTPAGIGARADSAPATATVTACTTAGPLPGHVRVKGDGSSPSMLVIVDGDPSATMLGCSDGYTAARVDGSGPSAYHAPDGGFTSRARAKSAAEIADSVVRYCALTPASA